MGNTNRISVTLPVGSGYYISIRTENADGPSAYSIPHRLVVSDDVSTPTLEQVIQNYAGNVIYNTYRDLANRAEKLNTAAVKLRFEPTDDHLRQLNINGLLRDVPGNNQKHFYSVRLIPMDWIRRWIAGR